jgi:hypothetical protein
MSDIEPLRGAKNLQLLELQETHINNFDPISTLRSLSSLHLGDCVCEDLSFLKGLSNLGYLRLHGTKVNDFSELVNLPALQFLSLEMISGRADIAVLLKSKGLKQIHVRGTEFDNSIVKMFHERRPDIKLFRYLSPTPISS